MEKTKRSYFMPMKLVGLIDEECRKSGYVREAIVAASIHAFLKASPNQRQKMLDEFNAFISDKRR
jgi:hypothetical protein